jgi:hypothetical protein
MILKMVRYKPENNVLLYSKYQRNYLSWHANMKELNGWNTV